MNISNHINHKWNIPKWLRYFIDIAVAVISVVGAFIVLEYSSTASIPGITSTVAHLRGFDLKYMFLNILTIGTVWIVVFVFVNRAWLASLIVSFACSVIGIINYYVVLLHGMPLSFLTLRNFMTAMNVIANYEIEITEITARMLIMMAALAIASIFSMVFGNGKSSLKWQKLIARDFIFLVVVSFVFYWGYFSENPVKPMGTIRWHWSEPYAKYGYAACTVETLMQVFYVANEPDGYSDNAVNAIEIDRMEVTSDRTPDVILILNETFYDLRQAVALGEDSPFLENIESLDNMLQGYAVVPSKGGGTNSAEYELLTSNSLELMPGVTPFNTLDLTGANSIASHMNALGYSTLGTHTEVKENYSRGDGYEKLAFQRRYFQEDYTDLEYYHNRHYASDESVYQNLIRWYEESPADKPRFLYMLTIQNHGGYSWNEEAVDTVHAAADFGEYDDDVDEFLTAIDQSDAAFVKLTDYFKESDRPVIICMMGDHSPSFAKSIVSEEYSDDEKNLRLRKVPLLIWANYELENQELGTMSMNYVVPTLLEIAGIKLSPYYQYLLQLKEQVPILTSYGVFYDKEGNMYHYSQENDPQLDAMVDDYFYLEYHNLHTDRNQALFDPYE